MNDIRYEPVFGDQTLFDDGPDDAEMVAIYALRLKRWYKLQDGECYLSTDKEQSWKRCRNGYPGFPFLAMRRIIRTPTWTKADQKAGKLPEVGAFYDAEGCRVKHLGVGAAGYEDIFHFEYPSGACGCSNKLFIKPIESPEEKAARLRVEWCKKAIGCAPISSEMQHYEMKRLGEYIGNIYDALLSGDLPVPVKE